MNRKLDSQDDSPYQRAMQAYRDKKYGRFLSTVEQFPFHQTSDTLLTMVEGLVSRPGTVGKTARRIMEKYTLGR